MLVVDLRGSQMGFLDSLFGKSKCPECGAKGARKSGGRLRCPNPSCRHFDGTVRGSNAVDMSGRRRPRRSDYFPEHPVEIHYRNFQGEEKTFTAEGESLERKHNHIVAQLAPTGEKIALSRDRIQNLDEVDRAVQSRAEQVRTEPTARERQVLGYHKKHKSTSPLYEEIRAKYPDW